MGKDKKETVALQNALSSGDLDLARACIQENGCSATDFNSIGYAPMYYAARSAKNGVDSVRMLRNEFGVDINSPCTHPRCDGDHPTKIAVIAGAVDVLRELLTMGADLGAPCDALGSPPAKYAVTKARPECLRIIQEEAGVDVKDVYDQYGNNLAFYAVQKGEAAILETLADLGMDMSKVCDGYGYTPAAYAAITERPECIQILSERGVDLNLPCDKYGNTPAKWAISEDNADVLKTLYLLGIDLTKPCNENGDIPTELARAENKDDLAELVEAMLLPDHLKPWICEVCSLENDPDGDMCAVCGAPMPQSPQRVQIPH